MTVNVRRRRRKTDPNYEKKNRIKKAAKDVGKTAVSVVVPFASAVIGGQGKEKWNKAAKKMKKKEGTKKKQVVDTDYLYGDWLDSPSKTAKKKREKYTKVDEEA